MSNDRELGRIEVPKMSGSEPFHIEGRPLDKTVLDFWSWSSSDIVGNRLRGLMAEYLVAVAMDADEECRYEWDAYDVITKTGIKIEVKAAAHIQSWDQKGYSTIRFDISPSRTWEARRNVYSNDKRRNADVYVFCVLDHKEQSTLDPLNLKQWKFFVLSKRILDQKVGDQRSIGLQPLMALGAEDVDFDSLKAAVESAAQ